MLIAHLHLSHVSSIFVVLLDKRWRVLPPMWLKFSQDTVCNFSKSHACMSAALMEVTEVWLSWFVGGYSCFFPSKLLMAANAVGKIRQK